jgi:hypothetical protein
LGFNRLCQLGECLGVEIATRLVFTALQQLNRQLQQLAVNTGLSTATIGINGACGLGWVSAVTEQRI